MTRSDFHEKQERRRERLLKRAEKAEARAQAARQRSDELASAIPFGQPILVGHHSEKRHRRDLERMRRGMRVAIEETQHAQDLRRRADVVGTAGISSDDPDAVQKLEEKCQDLEAAQAARKALNAAWRKAGRPAPADDAGWANVAALAGADAGDLTPIRQELAAPWRREGEPPFPSYALTNTNAELRRIKKRIAELAREGAAERKEVDHGFCRLLEEPADNRIRLVFAGKPSDEARALLKRYGFRWSPDAGAWQRHLNNAGRHAAETVVAELRRTAP